MALVEIDENELMNFRQVAGAMQKMLSNPKTRSKILEAQKIINPNVSIPEIDSAEPIRAALAEIQKESDETRKMLADDKAERETEKNLHALRNRWEAGQSVARKAGYTDEGLKALEDFMEANGIADHKLAMPAFERENPLPAPAENSKSGFDAFRASAPKDDDMKLLLEGNDQQFLSKRISQTLSDVRSGNR